MYARSGQQQRHATYDQPTYTYYTSDYPTARNTYSYTSSSSSRSGSQEPARYSYTYAPSYAYDHSSQNYSTPQPNTTYTRHERGHNRIPSDEYYRGRVSPVERERYSRDNEGYGYESPRGSPPPPYESDDYEDRFYNEQDREAFYNDIGKGSKNTTYTYSRPVEEELSSRSSSKRETKSAKATTPVRKTKAEAKPISDPPKYKIRMTTTTQTPQRPKTSFFSFDRKSSKSKPSPPQRTTTSSKSTSRSSSKSSSSSVPRSATAADAYAHAIPAGYSLKNWDPTRRPILLLGSVFDCNSLGKWIYDWTVHRCGPMSAFADMAGDLWVLLIGLGGRCSRGEGWVAKMSAQRSKRRTERQRQEDEDDVDLVEEFLDAGERLWIRLEGILEACEEWMYRAARRSGARVDARTGRVVAMGSESGCECVDSLFGRDRELETTEKLMASIRLWTVRWDRNVEEVVLGQ